VTRPTPRPQKENIAMNLGAKYRAVEPRIAMSWIDKNIRDFLAGRNEGQDLLHALYDHVLDEPVPERLRGVIKR
jgi:hypothetical protein